MMEEFKTKDRASMEPSSSSSLHESRKWHMAGFPLSNSSHGFENFSSPTSCTKGNTVKNSEALESRPLKIRKKLFDLQLPADEYVDHEEEENPRGYKRSDMSRGSIGLADLNEPIHIEEATTPSSIDFFSHNSRNGKTHSVDQVAGEPVNGINPFFGSRVNCRGWLTHANGAGSSIMQGAQPDNSSLFSHQGQGAMNHVRCSNGYNREEKFRDGFRNVLESSRSYSHSNSRHFEPIPSTTPGSHPFFHSVSSWAAPSSRPLQSSSPLHFDSCSKPAIDINLNEALPTVEEKSKPKENLPSWLRPKRTHVDEATDSKRLELLGDLEIPRKTETSPIPTVQKILGFPILERDVNLDCCDERRNVIIDINVACDPDEEPTTEKENPTKGSPEKDLFDLNSCVSDSENPSPPFYEQNGNCANRTFQIDLEAPVPESNEEVSRDAAETLVAISNTQNTLSLPCEASLGEEALLCLANAIYEAALDSSPEMDEFEATTLQLLEAKQDDYKPDPYQPETINPEETKARFLQTRTRRSNARRGRQLRDFQREILPGLASLSRHEVTEDLQIFGGLMKATGHSWNSLTRRNGTKKGAARGRRRVVVETAPLIEKRSLDDRSLTGWGKTTRRPRRQRCPAGNLAAVVLT